jgi:hypothetical protein
MSSSTRRRDGALPFWICRAISRFPRTVRVGSRLKRWKTNPILSRRICVRSASPTPEISTPSTKIWPEVGRARPPSRWSSVDFPHPDGPTMETNSPRSIWMSTPRKASTLTLPTW